MHRRLAAAFVALVPLACPQALADDPPPEVPEVPEVGEISPEIEALAADPLAGAGGAFPSPVLKPKLESSPRSPFFYALPVIGFWLILRRRNRGIRL